MNERVKELVEKVGTDSSGKWVSTDKMEEYTKLVIAECVKIIETWGEEDFAINGIAIEILDRFDMEIT